MTRRSLLAGTAGGAALTTAGSSIQAFASEPSRAPATTKDYRTKVVLLGTLGGPGWLDDPVRAGIASALVVGDRYYLVDAGEGAGRQIRASGIGTAGVGVGPLDRLGGIFLTHLHSDHIVDLNNLLMFGLFGGLEHTERKVTVWGPGNRGELPPLFGEPPEPPVVAPDNPTPGTREMVNLLVSAFATDYNDRSFDNRKPVPGELFEGRDVPIADDLLDDPNDEPHPRMSPVIFHEDDRVRVSATLVQHAPVFPALAYRFDTDDGAVVFSGDTGPSENLDELAEGADVLVHEVISREWVESLYPPPRSEAEEGIVNHHLNAHTSDEEVGEIAERAGAGTLVLTHFVPGSWPEHRWRRAVNGFSGRLVVGRDLDEVGVGARSKTSAT
ncbi:MBL fold metallo-hydrolase [Phytoactinopolyspora endophytica]|uniref:MBL fold metallo-hydrolase n=1 Tax=Phytoactinopolyspora endophytica TaxID=1642495 RepID=UPI00197B3693|nr:MBL fold metallo-hydrolase [Phytoactinopolyspora endophytica]